MSKIGDAPAVLADWPKPNDSLADEATNENESAVPPGVEPGAPSVPATAPILLPPTYSSSDHEPPGSLSPQ